jgi:UDP-glucuronate decarboxylase
MAKPDGFIGPVNLGNPTEHSVSQLAETIIEMTDSKSKLIFLPLPSDDPQQRQPDISLARSELDWEPKVALRDGLKETIAYFRQLLRD